MKKISPLNFEQLFEYWTTPALKEDLGTTRHNVWAMKNKGYIPQKHWRKLIEKANGRNIKISYQDLIKMYEAIGE